MSIFDPIYIDGEIDTKLKSLVFNRLSKDKFDSMSAHSPDEIWFIQDSELSGQPIVVDTRPVEIPTKLSEFQNDVPYLSSVSWYDINNRPTIPTQTSQLTNNSGYATSAYVDEQIASHSTKWRDWYQTEIAYVDYINTNRADFDTGYTPTESTVLKGRFRGDTVGQYYVGGRATTNGNCRWEVLDQPTWVGFCMPQSSWTGRLTATPWDQSKWWEIEMGNYYGNAVCEDGRTASASKSPVTFAPEASTITLKVGLSNYSWQGHWVEFDCAGFKLYEGETLVKDYRPALDPSGVVCFYEEVAQQYEYPYNGTWTAHMYNE